MLHKMMRFDANDEHIKKLRSDFAGIGQKVDARQLGTLPSNTVQHPENDEHCMAITTRGGKQTIDPPMPSKEKKVIKDNDKVIEVVLK